jgi:hypothetical protein
VYVAARLFSLNLPSWTGGGWFFNPLTWQLLFMMGAILSYAPGEAPRRHARWLDAAAIAVVVFGLLMQWVVWQHPQVVERLPGAVIRALMSVDKGGLHPFRLISILALTWLCVRLIRREAGWLRGWLAAPFIIAGQHSLPVFCASIFLSFLGRLATEANDGVLSQIGVNVAGAGSMWAVGAIAAWYSNKGRARRPGPACPLPVQESAPRHAGRDAGRSETGELVP